jgi:hypothetical protein
MGEYDKSSKWLIEHHGGSLLHLAGVRGVISWRPLPAEVVQPGQLPDGCLVAELEGHAEPGLFIIEIATYPERRLEEQLWRDALLVLLARRVTPEVVTLVLHPKGAMRASDRITLQSLLGWTEVSVRWRVVELWTVPAAALLRTNDPGLMPWVPLAQFEGPPELVIRECREVIDREAAPGERENLLAVTQVLTKLRFNNEALLALLGGRKAMIESPLIEEIVSEATAEIEAKATVNTILTVLRVRIGPIPPELDSTLRSIQDVRKLEHLVEAAARCESLDEFRAQMDTLA